jgi:transposase InsO family protein
VLDRCEHSRRVLGCAVADRMRAEIDVATLLMAYTSRGPATDNAIFRPDKGAQYNAREVVNQCKKMGLQRFMDANGCVYDLATDESFWSIFKHEFSHGKALAKMTELTFGIDVFYALV